MQKTIEIHLPHYEISLMQMASVLFMNDFLLHYWKFLSICFSNGREITFSALLWQLWNWHRFHWKKLQKILLQKNIKRGLFHLKIRVLENAPQSYTIQQIDIFMWISICAESRTIFWKFISQTCLKLWFLGGFQYPYKISHNSTDIAPNGINSIQIPNKSYK